jgi:hypothetical protein
MEKLTSAKSSTRGSSPWFVAAMLAMIAIPAAITLHTVRSPGTLRMNAPNPSPYGYTWSLLLFIVPILLIGFWLIPQEHLKIPRRAFLWTLMILVPLGFGLDFFFARWFFVFPNAQATLGIQAPALGAPVPVEEYIFYFTGFVAILLIYIWLDEFWLAAYNVADYRSEAQKIQRLLQFHPTSLLVGVALIAGAVIYKRVFAANSEGLPLYFVVLVAGGLIPSMAFFPIARPFINWRAFGLTLFFVVLISLLWEATLAIPYGWWGYQPTAMVGIFVGAWFGLPIEAVFVWMAAAYATAIVFEITKLWHASGRPMKQAFLGVRKEASAKRL